ncbi:Transposase [Streptomyces sp. OK228]|nr:Transposase [Streptomyces sp. OK228]
MSPWIVSDELWDRLEPLLPQRERRFRYPGRRPLPDREVLCGILYVLHTGIQWEYLPQELGFGSGMTCWRRLRDWNEAGVWQRLHEVLLAELKPRGWTGPAEHHWTNPSSTGWPMISSSFHPPHTHTEATAEAQTTRGQSGARRGPRGMVAFRAVCGPSKGGPQQPTTTNNDRPITGQR